MKLLTNLQKSFDFWFLLATSFIFFLFRLPSFFEPYWYGDEGVYEVLGFGMRHGRLLYQGIWDNKPPLLYLIYALFDGNQTLVRIFSFIVGLLAVYFFYFLSKELFENKKVRYFSTGFFALLLGLPLLEGNIANAENFMVLPGVMAFYILSKIINKKNLNLVYFLTSGILLGISFLIKVVAIFDFASVIFILAFINFSFNFSSIKKLVLQVFSLGIGFIIPFFLTIGFFIYKGILSIFIQSSFLSNVGYVSNGNQLIIPQGFLILKLGVLVLILSFVFIYRKKLSIIQIFMYVWLGFSLYNAFFSGRPYTHYVLVLLPSLSLLFASIFENKFRIKNFIFFALTIILLGFNFWFYGKIIWYYQNFAQFILGRETVSSYQSFFDKGVPRDYQVADFLKKQIKPTQKIFLWTNSAQIYYLIKRLPIGRYTVAYHMTLSPQSFAETSILLKKERPEILVVLPNASLFPFSMKDYRLIASFQDAAVYEKLF